MGVSPAGTFNAIEVQSGTTWGTSRLYTTGEVTLIAAIPEPSALAMVVLGLIVASQLCHGPRVL